MKPFLQSIEPMPAAFDQHYVKRLTAKHQKVGKNKCDLANQIRNDIAEFKTKTDRQVMIWTGSTEIFMSSSTAVHQTLAAFEKGLVDNDPGITPSMLYALGRPQRRHPLHQRRPQPHRRHPRAQRALPQDERPHRR